MKSKIQRHPRLYINISNKDKFYKLDYYDSQYNNDGSFKLNSILIPDKEFVNTESNKEKLYNLNKLEFQMLKSLIEKQKKVVKIYLEKNKQEQYQIVCSSLELLIEYEDFFLKWFSDNQISK